MEIIYDKVSYIYNEELSTSNKALNDINLALEEGKIYGLIGNMGSGKTTFIHLLNNLLTPSSGTVKVGEFILKKHNMIFNIKELRKSIGLVFQFPEEQFSETTVKKEIEFTLKNFKYKLDVAEEQIKNSLRMVGLDESYLNKNPFNLSNGEKRLVTIASILVYNSKVLVLDEPTAGLDYNNKKLLLNLLKRLNEKYKKTIIIVSHDIDMLYSFVHDIIVLEKGKVLICGTKEEVFKDATFFKDHNIPSPKIKEFTKKVLEKKKIKLGQYTDIKELIKAVYRNV
jgi:energy-coupling factor transport system ATP-binding protein